MAMVQSYTSRTSATEFRELLRSYEIAVANPKGKGEAALEAFRLRDKIEDLVVKLQESHVDIRAELTRLASADSLLQGSASKFVKELKASGGLAAVRARENPPQERWWWYIDVVLAAKNRKRIIGASITVGVIVIILVVVFVVVDKVAGPPPAFKEALSHITLAEGYLQSKDYDSAIREYEMAATLTPPELRMTPTVPPVAGTPQSMAPVYANADPQIYLAALYAIKGRDLDATSMEKAAERVMGSREGVLEALAQAFYNMNELEFASKTVDELLALNIDNARAYYIRGGIREMNGENEDALADFQHSAELAQAQFNSQLFAMAQTRYVNLLQRLPAMPVPTETPSS